MGLAGVLSRSRERSAAQRLALLRWRQATAVNAASAFARPHHHHPLAEASGQYVPGGGNTNGDGDSNGDGGECFGSDSSPRWTCATAVHDVDSGDRAVPEQEMAASPLLLQEQLVAAQAAAAMAREEANTLKSQHADVLQESRCEYI